MQEFSVKEISQILSGILKNAFPEMVAVTGEISQVSKQNSSGHIYFTLKEGDAVLNATYFKVNNDTHEITDSITGNFGYSIYPVDSSNKPIVYDFKK